jgi:Tfp pilus assembly protein PilE
MGLLLALMLGGVSAALTYVFGYPLWVMIVLGLLGLAAVVLSAIAGHHGFGGGGNTDLLIVIAGAAITAALLVPRYVAQHPCSQARAALARLAEAEKAYFADHKTYAANLTYLNMEQPPHIYLSILRGDDQSFLAVASHSACDNDTKGTHNVYMWDSAKDGLQ